MSITDVKFENGDFVVANGDFVLIHDNVAIVQAAGLNLRLQTGLNQYSPSSGWDWMRWLKSSIDSTQADQICLEVKNVIESIADVLSAKVTYLGLTSDEEASFDIVVETIYGTETIAYTLGGTNV